MLSEDLFPIVQKAIAKGYQLTPDAFQLLKETPLEKAIKMIEKALESADEQSDLFIIDSEFLKKSHIAPIKPKAPEQKYTMDLIFPEETHSIGSSDGFIDYFNSRFKQLEGIMKQRMELNDALPLEKVRELPLKAKFKAIGMVTNKSAKNNRLFLDIEDLDTMVHVMVSGEENIRKGLEVLEDQVIGFKGLKYREDFMIANELYWPDIPVHQVNRSPNRVSAVFIGDVHVGSKNFREDLFKKFIRWLNQDLGPQPSRDLASTVKYVIIAGDLVDGIGVYQNQFEELNISNQKAQYEKAAEFLEQFPPHIEIIIIPGNHDAVRRSLPQPIIPEKYAPSLYMNPRVHMAPNPVTVNLNNVRVFIAHGTALTNILGSTPGYNFHNPVKAVELLLRCRHIAPTYGEATPIAPEKIDRLIIKDIPDVVVMGHIHIYESSKYKGITLVSTGTFQDQTPYQKRMNLEPTSGVISVFNLKTHDQFPLDLERLN